MLVLFNEVVFIMATKTKKIESNVKAGRPVDPKSLRSRVRAAFEACGITATAEEIGNYILKHGGGKLKAKDLKTVPVQVSQIRKILLKKAGVKVVRKVGRPTLVNQAKMAEKFQAAVA